MEWDVKEKKGMRVRATVFGDRVNGPGKLLLMGKVKSLRARWVQ